jgi:hypothetical protein
MGNTKNAQPKRLSPPVETREALRSTVSQLALCPNPRKKNPTKNRPMMKTKAPASDLISAQHLAWLHQGASPVTAHELVARLLESTRLCLDTFDNGQVLATQSLLEDVMVQTLVAMRAMDMNPDQALQRGLYRLQGGAEHRAFHIFTDRVEIRVHEEVRGEWPLYTQSDYEAALTLARELGCDVIHEEACQLGLFSHPGRMGAERLERIANLA